MYRIVSKTVIAALIGAACFSAPAEAGQRWQKWRAHASQHISPELRAIGQIARSGQPPTVSIGVAVQVGPGGQPININQNADINIARVVQIGADSPATVEQNGILNITRINQRN